MWYKPTNDASISTPSILLYPDRIEENIRRMIRMAGGAHRLRPHVKTHKIPEVVRLQVAHGITKFKCATLAEVEMVAENGGSDILLAYPLLGPAIGQFFALNEQFPELKLAITIDSRAACHAVYDQVHQNGQHVNVLVDIDNGMHRTGIDPEKALDLIEFIVNQQSLVFNGLHIYDGHIHEHDPADREIHCDADFEPVTSLVEKLEEKGIVVKELACGGTPTFPVHAQYGSRTLCPGTLLLWDAGYARAFPDLEFMPAAVMAGRVISKPEQLLCLDLGHKSVASEMPHPRLHFFELDIDEVLNHSEEHLVVSTEQSSDLAVGDVVYALPTHICPTMALHDKVYVVKDQQVVETWSVVARRRKYAR